MDMNTSPEQLTAPDKKAPEFLFDLAEHLADKLERQGMAWDVAEYMATHWGGISVYFPKGTHMHQDRRVRRIWQEFNGKNHEELARKYNYSTQWIYKVVKRMREEEARLNQHSLFDKA